MGLYHWLISSLVDEDDDFCQRLRKSVVGILFFPGSFVALYYGILMVFAPGKAVGITRWISLTVNMLLVAVYWGQYFYVRWTHRVGHLQAAVVPWATVILLQGLAWFTVDRDKKPLWIILAMMAVLLQIPKIYLYLAFTSILILLQDWNTANLGQPDKILEPSAESYRSEPFDRFIYACFWTIILGVVSRSFITQVAESERRGNALKAANEMTLEILKYQRKYETEAIDHVLDKCKEVGEVEPELIGLYETMNDNLKSYRPFLPNYLFQETEEEDEGVLSASESINVTERHSNVSSKDDGGVAIGGVAEGGPSRMMMSQSRNTSIEVCNSIARTNDRSSHRGSSPAPPVTHLAISSLNKRGHLFEGRITFALLDINTDRLAINSNSDGQATSASILRTITQMVYSLAKETKASVHSMLGDTVQLTWNATNSVALAETKGAVFLCRLAKMLGLDNNGPTLNLNATVCSGKATVHNITTDNQQALVIEASWLPALEGCFDLAKQIGSITARVPRGCILMDDRTARGSALEVVSCPVEQVSYAEKGKPSFLGAYDNVHLNPCVPVAPQYHSAGGAATMVHQLLGEQVRTDEEWMYQLEGGGVGNGVTGGGGAAEAVSALCALRLRAIAAIADGNYAEGAVILEKLHSALLALPLVGANSGGKSSPQAESPEFLVALGAACRTGF